MAGSARRRPSRELLAEPRRQAAFELHRGAAGRAEERQPRASPNSWQSTISDQGLFGREVGRRQEVRARDAVALLRSSSRSAARPPRRSSPRSRKMRAPADVAGRGQRLSVAALSSLKQTDQLEQTMDSRQVHSAHSASGRAVQPFRAGCPASPTAGGRAVARSSTGFTSARSRRPRPAPSATRSAPVPSRLETPAAVSAPPRRRAARGAARSRAATPARAIARRPAATVRSGWAGRLPAGVGTSLGRRSFDRDARSTAASVCASAAGRRPAADHLRPREAVVQVEAGVAGPGTAAGVEVGLARPRPFGQVDAIVLQQRALAEVDLGDRHGCSRPASGSRRSRPRPAGAGRPSSTSSVSGARCRRRPGRASTSCLAAIAAVEVRLGINW